MIQARVRVRASVGFHVRVKKSALRAAESGEHSVSVSVEFLYPLILGREVVKIVVEPLFGELVEAVETLLWSSRRNFFLLSKRGNCQ